VSPASAVKASETSSHSVSPEKWEPDIEESEENPIAPTAVHVFEFEQAGSVNLFGRPSARDLLHGAGAISAHPTSSADEKERISSQLKAGPNRSLEPEQDSNDGDHDVALSSTRDSGGFGEDAGTKRPARFDWERLQREDFNDDFLQVSHAPQFSKPACATDTAAAFSDGKNEGGHHMDGALGWLQDALQNAPAPAPAPVVKRSTPAVATVVRRTRSASSDSLQRTDSANVVRASKMLKLVQQGLSDTQVHAHESMREYDLTLTQITRFRQLSGVRLDGEGGGGGGGGGDVPDHYCNEATATPKHHRPSNETVRDANKTAPVGSADSENMPSNTAVAGGGGSGGGGSGGGGEGEGDGDGDLSVTAECEAAMLKLLKKGSTNEQVMRHFSMVDYNLTPPHVQRVRDKAGIAATGRWIKGIGRVNSNAIAITSGGGRSKNLNSLIQS
jgi:hypothetical protein